MGTALKVALALIAAVHSPEPSETVAVGPTGTWYQFEWGGFVENADKSCVLATVIQRRYDLVTRAQIVSGIYSVVRQRFVFWSNKECKFEGKVIPPTDFQASRHWSVSGYSDASGTRVSGRFLHCAFDGCDHPTATKTPFTSELTLSGGHLLEQDESEIGRAITFQPLAGYGTVTAAVMNATNTLLQATKTGDVAAVAPLVATTGVQAEARKNFLISIPVYAERNRSIEGLEVITSYVMDPSPATPTSITRLAIVMQRATMSDGTMAPFITLFAEERGRWLFVPF